MGLARKVYSRRLMIWTMAVRQIQSRYAGSVGGFLWAIVCPLMTVLIYWFVFSVGLRVRPVGDLPFVVVLFCGLTAWTLFSETVLMSLTSVMANKHLVSKTVFPTEVLPLVCLVAGLVTHVIMVVILIALVLANGISLSAYALQWPYYVVGLSVLLLGLGWLLAALNVFYRDTGHAVGIILNLWFWMSPIVWAMESIPKQYHFYLKLNPLCYIVEGYKACFLYPKPFWHNWTEGIYFWVVSLAMLVGGGLFFRRLKSGFADVI